MHEYFGYSLAFLPWFLVAGKIFFWVALIVVLLAVLRRNGRDTGNGHGSFPSSGDDEAVRILRKRFAEGEIDKAEFEERLRALR